MLSLIAQGAFNPSPFLMPDTAGETILLYGLTTLNFLAFITVLFVLLRNVLKLVRERQAERLGSKFKARLVSYAIGLSLLPALLLFFFSFGLLNRSIDRWFGEPARQIVDDAQTIEESYFRKEEIELQRIARSITRGSSLAGRSDYSSPALKHDVREEMDEYQLALVRIVAPGQTVTIQSDDATVESEIEETLLKGEQQLHGAPDPFNGRDEGDSPMAIYVISGVRLTDSPSDARMILVAREFPPELTERTANIAEQHRNFHGLLGKIKRIKAIFILLLGAVTLLVIFAATWLALYVARGITVPIQSLVEATDRVAHGDVPRPVDIAAQDELAVLVNSFNQMASQLGENRARIERAAEDLRRSNSALEDRRRYIETVLESLSTGVISTDDAMRITTINRAALFMLGLAEKPQAQTELGGVLAGEPGEGLAALCRRARRIDSAQSEIEFIHLDGTSVHTATTAISLKNSEGNVEGFVVVIEDLTDLIQAERAAAWSEVARRMAHEIKNPLTPIQLSAERIVRNYSRAAASESRFEEILHEGSSTIIREVSALQRMVEEFSLFARLPEARPVEASLNEIVRDAVDLYADRLNSIQLDCRLSEDLPLLRLDRDQFKRVLVNLIDNAIEAMSQDGAGDGNGSNSNGAGSPGNSISIHSYHVASNDVVRLTVADTGHGIPPADRDKLFLPKFSTRERGTGLGLAIVSHIVSDHKGRIWVEDNYPCGAAFTIELPVGPVQPD
jgi:two-component system, NtrC family, nitrogen regulation sensor histidine kinase NtrY